MSGSVEGLDAIQRRLAELRQRVEQAAAAGAFVAANEIMTNAKERCPVDTGALRGSGHVSEPVVADGRVSVEVGFGGPSAPYAEIVHERTEVRHPIGEAKYLENAVNAHSTSTPKIIAEHIKQALGAA